MPDFLKTQEQLIAEGSIGEAQKRQKEQYDKDYNTKLASNFAQLAELADQEETVQVRYQLKQLVKERNKLIKIAEKETDYERVNEEWKKTRLQEYKQVYGNDIPVELVNYVQSVFNDANANGLRVRVNKNRRAATDLIIGKQLEAETLIEQGKFPEAAVKLEESISDIKIFNTANIYSKKESNNLIKDARQDFAGRIIGGAINDANTAIEVEGYEAGLAVWDKWKPVIKQYENTLGDKGKEILSKYRKFVKAAKDDTATLLQSIGASYARGVKSGALSPEQLNVLNNRQKTLIDKELSNPHVKPAIKTKLKLAKQELDGKSKYLSGLRKAVSGDKKYTNLIAGATVEEFAKITGLKSGSPEFFGALEDYANGRQPYNFDRDPVAAAYAYHNRLTGRKPPENLVERIKDEIEISKRYYGKTGLSKPTKDIYVESYNNPFTESDVKAELGSLARQYGAALGITGLIAKDEVPELNNSVHSFLAYNADVFTNVNLSDPSSYEKFKQFFTNHDGAEKATQKVESYISTKYRGNIELVAKQYGIPYDIALQGIAVDIVAGQASGRVGTIGIQGLNSLSETEIHKQGSLQTEIDGKIEQLNEKITTVGDSYIRRSTEYDALPRGVKSYLDDVFRDYRILKDSFPFDTTATQKEFPFVRQFNLSAHQHNDIKNRLRILTGNNKLETYSRLRIKDNVGAKAYELMLDAGDGSTLLPLKYQNSRSIIIRKDDLTKVFAGKQNIKEDEFVDLLFEAITLGASR